jgi:hypothetical protein
MHTHKLGLGDFENERTGVGGGGEGGGGVGGGGLGGGGGDGGGCAYIGVRKRGLERQKYPNWISRDCYPDLGSSFRVK